ncbi:hypothetical protein FKM82_019628 [Ascaphus truei]
MIYAFLLPTRDCGFPTCYIQLEVFFVYLWVYILYGNNFTYNWYCPDELGIVSMISNYVSINVNEGSAQVIILYFNNNKTKKV